MKPSRTWRPLIAWVLLSCSFGTSAQTNVTLTRADQASVVAKAYLPATAPCRGVAVISHGAGGSEQGYRYLGVALQNLGFLTLVVGHSESGLAALRDHMQNSPPRARLREGLSGLITDPQAYRARLMDITAARSWAQARCPAHRSVLVGHSMGAATVMIEAGARNQMQVRGTDAWDAYIALSPQGAGALFPASAWDAIRKPLLMVTGTRDTELGGASWMTRTEAFDNMPSGCKWLGVIEGATHMHFAGRGDGSQQTEDIVTRLAATFLDGVDRGDCSKPSSEPGLAIRTK
ncbi:MAG: alpha/beta hydrolase [Betaproteobacteria bacterium]|nr:alpha/beta hydrolase [Betaproteobacteria bacterium]